MRYNQYLTIDKMFPTLQKGRCARCQAQLTGRRRRWCSRECEWASVTDFLVRKGDVGAIRRQLQRRDQGKCAACGIQAHEWDADHIVAVVNGGGGCDLSGYQTLCKPCHKQKTKADLLIRRQRTSATPSAPSMTNG